MHIYDCTDFVFSNKRYERRGTKCHQIILNDDAIYSVGAGPTFFCYKLSYSFTLLLLNFFQL
jgi:hypothetical protein